MKRSLKLLTVTLTTLASVAVESRADVTVASRPKQQIVLKIEGKPDRRCTVVSFTPQADGALLYRLKALDNGEEFVVEDRPNTKAAKPTKESDTQAQVPTGDPLLGGHESPSKTLVNQPTKMPKEPVPLQQVPAHTQAPVLAKQTPTLPPEPAPLNHPAVRAPETLVSTLPTPPTTDPVALNAGLKIPTSPPSGADPVPVGYAIPTNPSATRTPFAGDARLLELRNELHNALRPSHREHAAEELAELSGSESPEVRTLLINAVVEDPSPTVRATCLRCLHKIGVRDRVYTSLLVLAERDPDERVRGEVARLKALEKR